MAGILSYLLIFLLSFSFLGGQLPPPESRRIPVLHPGIESLGRRPDSRIHAWIFFRDKGLERGSYPGALAKAEAELTQPAVSRRSKVMGNTIVSFRDIPVNDLYIDRVIASGASLRQKSRWLNAVSVSATEEQLAAISLFSFVASIDPVLVHKRPLTKEEELLPLQGWGQPRGLPTGTADTLDYGNSADQIRQIRGDLAHEAGYAGQGVVVLMLDTGYFKDHESIQKDRIIAEWDFINGDGNTQDEGGDSVRQHSHGTYTLSALGGFKPGSLIGPAYESKFLLAKTEIVAEEIQQEEDNYVAALEWGERLGAHVASSSLGYLDWYTYRDMDGNTAVTTKAVDTAVSLGIVCITSAGNEGSGDWYYIIAPADADSVISVGAVDSRGQIAPFSSHGPTYDGRFKPEVTARGVGTFCASAAGVDRYAQVSGTSLAAPLVAGGAAVILSAHPGWTPMMVREALLKTASRADFPDNSYGWGIIDIWAAINFSSFSGGPNPYPPSRFRLAQNYPNPFNVSTIIPFDVPVQSHVSLIVFNLLGQPIATLVDDEREIGRYSVQWNGSRFPSGLYLFQMKSGEFTESRKMILIK
ncbi:MAG: S8 family peptidase [Fidelibacterota bacterium]